MVEKKEEQKIEGKEDSKKEKEFVLVNVATQHAPAIQSPEGEILQGEEALILLLNNQVKIMKALL